jgi:hypothetical protein
MVRSHLLPANRDAELPVLSIKLDPLQSQAWRLLRPGTKAAFPWGRGTGKTYFDAAAIHTWCLERPGRHVGLLLPTLKQARAVFWMPVLLPQFYGELKLYVKRPNLTELFCEYRNGSRLSTWGAENANAIRGQRFDCLVQDEADDIEVDVENAVVEPTFSKSGSRAIWLKTGTPKRGRYGTLFESYRNGQDGTPERKALAAKGVDVSEFVSLLFRSDQSPQVDRRWLDGVKRKLIAGGRKTTYLREYECDFDAAEGLVYDLDQTIHVAEPPTGIRWSEILVGIDHGFEDPAVFLTIGVQGSGRDAELWIIDEFYESHMETYQLVAQGKRIKERHKGTPQRWYADPSRPDTIASYRGAGLPVQEANNAIEDGVRAVADRMAVREELPDVWGAPVKRCTRLHVSPRCVRTLEEFGKYRRKRDPKDGDRILDHIEDKHNHAMDSLRYSIFTRFGGPPAERGMIDAPILPFG